MSGAGEGWRAKALSSTPSRGSYLGLTIPIDSLPDGTPVRAVQMDGWLKDVGPSTTLRRWYSHDPAKWDEFRKRYFAELAEATPTWQPLLEAAREGTVTLLYSTHDTEHNTALALKEYLEKKLAR